MIAEVNTSKNDSTSTTTSTPPAPQPVKAKNPAAVKKAVAMGKEMLKVANTRKATVAMNIYEHLVDEPRDIIVQAFIDGAGLTPKGAQTYFYNCRRKVKKVTSAQAAATMEE